MMCVNMRKKKQTKKHIEILKNKKEYLSSNEKQKTKNKNQVRLITAT